MCIRWLILVLAALGSLSCSTSVIRPDTGTQGATLNGTVHPFGSQLLLPDVPVRAGTTTVRTTVRGNYSIPDLLPGEIDVMVEYEGYDPYVRRIRLVEGVNTLTINLIPEL